MRNRKRSRGRKGGVREWVNHWSNLAGDDETGEGLRGQLIAYALLDQDGRPTAKARRLGLVDARAKSAPWDRKAWGEVSAMIRRAEEGEPVPAPLRR